MNKTFNRTSRTDWLVPKNKNSNKNNSQSREQKGSRHESNSFIKRELKKQKELIDEEPFN